MNRAGRRWVAVAGVASCVLGLSGCAGNPLHLHSTTREEQGKTAQEKWDAAYKAAQAVIEKRRERTKALFREVDATSQALASVKVDSQLYTFAVADPNSLETGQKLQTIRTVLVNPIDVSLESLGVKVPLLSPELEVTLLPMGLPTAFSLALQLEQKLQSAQATLHKLGGQMDFSCDKWNDPAFRQQISKWGTDLATHDAGAFASAKKTVQDIDNLCPADAERRQNAPLRKLATEMSAGPLRTDIDALLNKMSGLSRAKDAQAVDRAVFVNALNDYRAALESESAMPPVASVTPAPAASAVPPADAASAAKSLTPVQAAGQKLSNVLAKLHSVNDMFSLKLLSEKSTKGIDEFLGSLESPKDPSDAKATSKDRAALALVTLSKTGEDWKTAQAQIYAIDRRPLAMIQDIEQLKLQRAQIAIAAQELAVELQEQKVRVRIEQVKAYLAAGILVRRNLALDLDRTLQQAIYGDESRPCDRPKPDEKVKPCLKHTPPLEMQQKKALMRASGQYWYASAHLEQQTKSLDAKIGLLAELDKANKTDNSLKQWDLLIRAQVDMLADWSKTGITRNTISQGLNALLLIWIGLGVH